MKRHNLTLIEILGVTALIVILLTIGIGAYTYASNSSKEKATTATIARISNALQLLQDKGLLKKTTGTATDSTNGFVTIKFDADNRKVTIGSTDLSDDAFKMFARAVDADSIDAILNENKMISDGWEQQILVRYPGKFNRGGFDIISAGSDGVFGTGTSETVPPVDINEYKDSEGDLICDDISNFF